MVVRWSFTIHVVFMVRASLARNQLPNRDELRDKSFWNSVAKGLGLHVDDRKFFRKQTMATWLPENLTSLALQDRMRREGYLQFQPSDFLPWQQPLGPMVEVIDELQRRGLPVAFGYMFDEFWYAMMRLHPLLQIVLGSKYKRKPELWAWHLNSGLEEAGWSPHRDKDGFPLFPDGSPKSATAWIPLTDATVLNGCIYVLPAHLDQFYMSDIPSFPNPPPQGFLEAMLPDVRALPTNAGGALIWNQRVMHWGSRASSLSKGQRYSIATEYQAGKVPQDRRDNPCQELSDPLSLPSFDERLRLLVCLVPRYAHFSNVSKKLIKQLARLKDELGSEKQKMTGKGVATQRGEPGKKEL